jgi:hypothetical protein
VIEVVLEVELEVVLEVVELVGFVCFYIHIRP